MWVNELILKQEITEFLYVRNLFSEKKITVLPYYEESIIIYPYLLVLKIISFFSYFLCERGTPDFPSKCKYNIILSVTIQEPYRCQPVTKKLQQLSLKNDTHKFHFQMHYVRFPPKMGQSQEWLKTRRSQDKEIVLRKKDQEWNRILFATSIGSTISKITVYIIGKFLIKRFPFLFSYPHFFFFPGLPVFQHLKSSPCKIPRMPSACGIRVFIFKFIQPAPTDNKASSPVDL